MDSMHENKFQSYKTNSYLGESLIPDPSMQDQRMSIQSNATGYDIPSDSDSDKEETIVFGQQGQLTVLV